MRRKTTRCVGETRRTLTGEEFLELDAPFSLGAIHLEHGDPHDEDHKARGQLKYACERDLAMSTANDRHTNPRKRLTFPELLGFCPGISSLGEPDGDEGCAYGQGNDKAEAGT